VSKKDKTIQIIEEEKMINGQLVLELTTKKDKIGQVVTEAERFVAILPSGERFKVTTQDEAVDLLIRDYHLHRG